MDINTEPSLGAKELVDRYRCPEGLTSFLLKGQVHPTPGFFKFGDGAICYGQCALGETQVQPSGQLFDALDAAIVDPLEVYLPFDPSQVIANLRSERYLGDERGAFKGLAGAKVIRALYYLLRPLMAVWIRKHLQRVYFRRWDQIRFPQWPVDFSVEAIHEGLLRLAIKARQGKAIPFIWFWPKGAASCTIVTHDVETQYGVDCCPKLMDLNDSFEIKTAFQVVPEERYLVLDSFLGEIRRRGFEVNVHDLNHDGNLFRDKAEFLRRAVLINRYVKSFGARGFRSAVLYRNLDWQRALDVSYDMSVPTVSHLEPQQGGCCTVLPFFVGDIVELPVTMTQDYSLFHILGLYSTDLWREQAKQIIQRNGLLSVIIHPDYIFEERACRVYRDLLSYLAELRSSGRTWIALPNEVAEWWRQRNRLTLVQRGDSWCIEGEGKERACLANAILEGDSLRYELAPQI